MRCCCALARRDAARGALRSAEHLLAEAAAAGSGPGSLLRSPPSGSRVLTLVGRAADALALGAAELDGLRGDAHADRATRGRTLRVSSWIGGPTVSVV